jgi:uncharacterized protein involved in exopolysaccharide biosynthesis
LALAAFVVVAGLTVVAAIVWPRTFHCESKLMAQRNEVLASHNGGDPLRGASDVILRHDNLEAIVKQTDLVRSWEANRPPVLRVKDWVMALRGKPSDADKIQILVGTLESKLSVTATDASLTVGVDWPDPHVAARLVETVEQNFLESRHVAEVTSVADFIAILEGHAAKLRGEIDGLAEQIQRMSEERLSQAERNAQRPSDTAPSPTPTARRTSPRPRLQVDEDLPRLKVQLQAKQDSIRQFEEDRKRRLAELQAKLTEFRSRYTPAHPAVVDLERQIASMSQDSPQLATLKAEAQQLEADIKGRTAAYVEGSQRAEPQLEAGGGGGGGAPGALPTVAPQAGPLPTDIMQLMQSNADGLDPAIGAQFRYAVSKYTAVRDQISTARIDLDTAQAAFSYRYKIVTPPQPPMRPSKPKIPVMIGGGLFAALLLALALPILLELKTGKIVERWQVAQIRLPILAELKLPPGSQD